MRQSAKGRSARLSVETLEARDCPAFNIFYTGSALVVRGTPTLPFSGLGDGLNFNLLAGGNVLQIQEVGNAGATVKGLGAYRPVRNLIVQLGFTNTDINFNLNGARLVSHVLLSLGKGDINPLSPNGVNFQDGTLGGNLTILGGAGIETISVGRTDILGALPVAVQGNLTLVGRPRRDPVGFGDSLYLNAGSSVRGFLNAVQIDNVDVGEATGLVARVSRSLSMNVAGSRNVGRLNVYGEVAGDVMFQGTNALDTFFTDSVILHGDNPTPAVVGSNLVANYGFGDARMLVEPGTEVRGDVLFSANGAGSIGAPPPPPFPFFNQLIFAGTAGGDVRFYGDGASEIIFPSSGTVNGNFTVRAGNGDNDLSAFAGSVAGSVFVYLGNGDNVMTLAQAPGGRLYWNSGNGTNVLTLADANTPASAWDVRIRFGTGDDTLTLSGVAPQSLTGVVRDDGSISGNTFNQGANWTLLPTLVFINFP